MFNTACSDRLDRLSQVCVLPALLSALPHVLSALPHMLSALPQVLSAVVSAANPLIVLAAGGSAWRSCMTCELHCSEACPTTSVLRDTSTKETESRLTTRIKNKNMDCKQSIAVTTSTWYTAIRVRTCSPVPLSSSNSRCMLPTSITNMYIPSSTANVLSMPGRVLYTLRTA